MKKANTPVYLDIRRKIRFSGTELGQLYTNTIDQIVLCPVSIDCHSSGHLIRESFFDHVHFIGSYVSTKERRNSKVDFALAM